jgi:hypothetical protein
MNERMVCRHLRRRVSNATSRYAGKGVVRYQLVDATSGFVKVCGWRPGLTMSVQGKIGNRGRFVLRAIMDISARAFSLADRPRSGHSGHQCSHALGRPILHFVLSSRRPRLDAVYRLRRRLHLISRSSFVRANGRSFVPQSVARIKRVGRLHRRSSSVRRRAL